MKDVRRKANEFNRKYHLSEAQNNKFTIAQGELAAGEFSEVKKLDEEFTRDGNLGSAFNAVASVYAGYFDGLPVSYDSLFDALYQINIFVRGRTKEENLAEYDKVFSNTATKDDESSEKFADFIKILRGKIQPRLDKLEVLGKKSYELNLAAVDKLKKQGEIFRTHEEVANMNKLLGKTKRK